MTNSSGNKSVTNYAETIQASVNQFILLLIGTIILDQIKWVVTPRTPYHLRKRIHYLEVQLINKTLEVNEEIIRP